MMIVNVFNNHQIRLGRVFEGFVVEVDAGDFLDEGKSETR